MKKNLREIAEEYKGQVEALAKQAAEVPSLREKIAAFEAEKLNLTNDLETLKASLVSSETEKETFKAQLAEAQTKITAMQAEAASTDEKALELIAGLGIIKAPEVEPEQEGDSAEAIRSKYLAISDPVEKGKFYEQNKEIIMNGF